MSAAVDVMLLFDAVVGVLDVLSVDVVMDAMDVDVRMDVEFVKGVLDVALVENANVCDLDEVSSWLVTDDEV
ncbi:MAG: hypothetical protein WA667_15115 [Candidatus Nitrosopolaris sp.]